MGDRRGGRGRIVTIVFCLGVCATGWGVEGAKGAQADIAVYPGCDAPKPQAHGRTFYIDPARGSASNDGSRERPWRTLAETLDAKARLLATRGLVGRDPTPAPINPNGPIHPGDTLELMSGDHGDVHLYGYLNEDFISVVAAPGQTPVVGSLTLARASRWLFRGVAFRGAKPEGEAHKWEPLVRLGPAGAEPGVNADLIFVGDSFATQDKVEGWSPTDWVEKPRMYGVQSAAECVSLVGNRFFNLRNAIALAGERTLAQGNLVESFGNDGFDVSASNLIVRGNTIRDSRHTPLEPLHADGIQGWTVHDQVNRNVRIEGNRIINLNPSDDNYLQGISIFDGRWDGLDVVNNLVITNIWHGVALYGVDNARVFNNTVLPARPGKAMTWLTIHDAKDGRPSRGVVVRNNIAGSLVVNGQEIQFDHNLSLKRAAPTRNGGPEPLAGERNAFSPELLSRFVDYDLKAQRFDLRPNPESPARAAGAGEGAPAVDIDGRDRAQPPDIGAFAR